MYSNTDITLNKVAGNIEINPYEPAQLQVNSYDVCLGNSFYEVFWDNIGPYFVGPYIYLDGEKVTIPVSGTLLGVTKERIGTKGKVVAELRSKSTTRRIGITTNCDAGLGDIGYSDFWTLEFTAFVENSLIVRLMRAANNWLSKNGLVAPYLTSWIEKHQNNQPYLIVGQPVAQMVFYECQNAPTNEYSGQYKSEWPQNMVPKQWRHRIEAPK